MWHDSCPEDDSADFELFDSGELKHKASGQCASFRYAKWGSPSSVEECDGSEYQKWTFKENPGKKGFFQVVNTKFNTCFDIPWHDGRVGRINAWKCSFSDGDNMMW